MQKSVLAINLIELKFFPSLQNIRGQTSQLIKGNAITVLDSKRIQETYH